MAAGFCSPQIATWLLRVRADIHTLLDLNLIGINPESLQLVIAEQLKNTCYEELDGYDLTVPDDEMMAPNKESLEARWKTWEATNDPD